MENNEIQERSFIFKTTCKECIFAEWVGLTQTGCYFNRLDKFEDQDKLRLVDDDDGTQHYEIQTYCNTCRNEEWADKYDDPVEQIKKDVEVKASFLIIDDSNDVFPKVRQNILRTLDSVLAQEIKPKSVIISSNNAHTNFPTLFKDVKEKLQEKGIKFEVVRPINLSVTMLELVNSLAKKCNFTYFSVFKNGYEIESNFLSKLNNLINIDLRQVSLIVPKDKENGLTFQTLLFNRVIGGNSEDMTAVEKIQMLAKDQDKKEMIVSDEEFNARI